MKIEHIALYVADLERARTFFTTYFGAVSNGGYHNPSTNFRSYFLTFSDGARLELMTKPGLSGVSGSSDHFGYAHIAFSLGSRQAVDTLTDTLRQANYPVLSGPRVTGDGYYESCIRGPEGICIEITV